MSNAKTARGKCGVETISGKDREVLRRLAGRVAEIARRPEQAERRALWYDLNALRPTRPVVYCSPECGWEEIIRPGDMECEGGTARAWEHFLRTEVFYGDIMGDDKVVTGVLSVGYVHSNSGWGVQETYTYGDNRGSYVWDAPVKDLSNLSGLRVPEIAVDRDASDSVLDLAHDVFDGVLEVRRHHTWLWSVGLTQTLIRLRGLEQIMLDMVTDPAGLHRIMAFLRDAHLAMLDFLEREHLLHLNNRGEYVGSGGFGWTDELPAPGFEGHVRALDLWALGESQETVGVSPAMFEEFVFQYQLPLLERFGLTCYGCCEPVHTRWHILKRIPNLRRVSVSPWCDVAQMAESLQDRYILSLKPNPAHLATSFFDEDVVRRDIRARLHQARGCRIEIIMKDCHTIGGDFRRVVRWCQIAREESERFALRA